MSIKSKGKTKQRSVARGPRRAPVPVPKPFAQRRWVQFTALFVAGVLVTLFVFWGWHGWRGYQADHRAAQELATRQQALSKWKAVLEAQITAVGQLQGSVPPTVATDITAAVQALASGEPPPSTSADLQTSASALGKAAKALDDFDLAGTITEQGFDARASTALTSSKVELIQALRLYQQAGRLAILAMAADGKTQTDLASSAKAVGDSAASLLEAGWLKYTSTLADNQLSPGGQSNGAAGGLGGLSGGTGG